MAPRSLLVAVLGAGIVLGYLAHGLHLGAHLAAPSVGLRVPDLWQESVDDFRSTPETQVLLIGDSLTARGRWPERLGRPVTNEGINGDTTAGLLARLPAGGRCIFVMAGINDILQGAPPVEVAARMHRILAGLSPRRTFLQSIPIPRDKLLAAQVRDLNARYAALCDTGCTFVDVAKDVTPGARDGIHLSAENYRVWAAKVRPLLEGCASD